MTASEQASDDLLVTSTLHYGKDGRAAESGFDGGDYGGIETDHLQETPDTLRKGRSITATSGPWSRRVRRPTSCSRSRRVWSTSTRPLPAAPHPVLDHTQPLDRERRCNEMPVTIDGVRKLLKVEPSPEDKGLTLTVRVTAYDNGVVTINGRPLRVERDLGLGLLAASEHTAAHLGEFYRLVQQRRADSATRKPGRA
jgi:hypothetical protein